MLRLSKELMETGAKKQRQQTQGLLFSQAVMEQQ